MEYLLNYPEVLNFVATIFWTWYLLKDSKWRRK